MATKQLKESDWDLTARYGALFPLLNERQERLLAAADVLGLKLTITEVARASGLARSTIYAGIAELRSGRVDASERIRRPGAGRKLAEVADRELKRTLERVIAPHTRGSPMSPLKWTSKSTRNLAQALTELGHKIGRNGVARLLHRLGYSLKGNTKQIEGTSHPDRNAQFEFINRLAGRFLRAREPVVSVDTKKKELVGQYRNAGREWSPSGATTRVNVHDFIDPATPKAIPYGVYDIADDSGFVSVGIDHDTAEFAVESIRVWYEEMGQARYPRAKKLLICADAGGSNGYRTRLWKVELQKFANETGLAVSVSHFPPGTSKWNKIEHRLFSFITMNWRGKPLTTYQAVVNLIAATTTRSGLKTHAHLDRRKYQKGRKISDEEFATVDLRSNIFHGEWNYTIRPNN